MKFNLRVRRNEEEQESVTFSTEHFDPSKKLKILSRVKKLIGTNERKSLEPLATTADSIAHQLENRTPVPLKHILNLVRLQNRQIYVYFSETNHSHSVLVKGLSENERQMIQELFDSGVKLARKESAEGPKKRLLP